MSRAVIMKVETIARGIVAKLAPHCKRIEIAGSIRRKKAEPNDIDIVIIPSDRPAIEKYIKSIDKKVRWGERIISIIEKNGIQVDFYFCTPDEWGAMLMTLTGPSGSNIGLRTMAKKKGWKLNQYGLYDACGNKIAGKTEESIYKALGRPWKEPENRGK